MDKTIFSSFTGRGGWWVLAQVPVLAQAAMVPWWTRAGFFDPANTVQLAGVLLTGAGVLLTTAGLFTLGNALTPFPKPLDNATLRRQGVYQLMRHPIYAGLMVAAAGWSLWCLSWSGMASLAITIVFFDRKAAHEERWLRSQYPDYAAYAGKVKRFLPGIY